MLTVPCRSTGWKETNRIIETMPKKFLSKVVCILISVLRLNTSSDLQKSLSMINRQIINPRYM